MIPFKYDAEIMKRFPKPAGGTMLGTDLHNGPTPVAAFDLRGVHGTLTVRFATGREQFTPLGEAAVEHSEPREVIFVDEAGLVVARRWCWRQSEESASRENKNAALFTIEAQHAGGRAVVAQALADLRGLLEQYAGGVYESEMVQ